jgi:hypothetical protein
MKFARVRKIAAEIICFLVVWAMMLLAFVASTVETHNLNLARVGAFAAISFLALLFARTIWFD